MYLLLLLLLSQSLLAVWATALARPPTATASPACLLQLRDTFITVDRSECDSGVNQNTAITFSQVSGEEAWAPGRSLGRAASWPGAGLLVSVCRRVLPGETSYQPGQAPYASQLAHALPDASLVFAGLWIILAAGLGAALLWLAGLRLWKAHKLRRRRAEAAAAEAAAEAEARKLGPDAEAAVEEANGNAGRPRGDARRRSHAYKAGVAFKQTVSIFGAQASILCVWWGRLNYIFY